MSAPTHDYLAWSAATYPHGPCKYMEEGARCGLPKADPIHTVKASVSVQFAVKALEKELGQVTKLRDDAVEKAATARASALSWEECVPRHQQHLDELTEALAVLKKETP